MLGVSSRQLCSVLHCVRRVHCSYYSMSEKKVIVISGCDSGLGYSLAQRCLKRGARVAAGCLHPNGEGAKNLKELGGDVLPLDVTDRASIKNLVDSVVASKLEVQAVINNAAVMVFGEFEWQTVKQIEQQVQVNLVGAINLAQACMPLLRRDKGDFLLPRLLEKITPQNIGRLINVVSHCALVGLPALSIYGATKAAMLMWNDAIRIEQAKYGVRVISFMPGSFYGHSQIMAEQSKHAEEMLREMKDDSRAFHINHFLKVQKYLSQLPCPSGPTIIQDDKLLSMLEHAVVSENPKPSYRHEPARYAIYHWLFKISPIRIRDILVTKFVNMPSYSK